MKHFILSFFVLCVFASSSSAQVGFEGTMTWSVKIPMLGDQESPFVISAKGDKTLIKMDAGPTGALDMYSDKSTKKSFIVMKAMNMGYEMDIEDEKSDKGNAKAPTPKATGKKEKISNYFCDEYTCELDGGALMSIWMTSELKGHLLEVMSQAINKGMGASGTNLGGMAELVKKGLAPVRTVVTKDGKEQIVMTFVSFEPKVLSDEIFVVPTGINFMKMPAGMGR